MWFGGGDRKGERAGEKLLFQPAGGGADKSADCNKEKEKKTITKIIKPESVLCTNILSFNNRTQNVHQQYPSVSSISFMLRPPPAHHSH